MEIHCTPAMREAFRFAYRDWEEPPELRLYSAPVVEPVWNERPSSAYIDGLRDSEELRKRNAEAVRVADRLREEQDAVRKEQERALSMMLSDTAVRSVIVALEKTGDLLWTPASPVAHLPGGLQYAWFLDKAAQLMGALGDVEYDSLDLEFARIFTRVAESGYRVLRHVSMRRSAGGFTLLDFAEPY